MEREPGQGDGMGGTPGPGLPGGAARPSGFALGGDLAACAPSAALAAAAEAAAGALAMSVTSAENLMWLAWDLHAQLPAIGEQLAAGQLTLAKARAVDQALGPLADQDATAAEAMILPHLAGKTHAQVARLAEQAAITVDPQSAARRREEAERSRSRVALFREESGAAGLSGRDLPTGQALAAHARVCERAAEYNDSGAFGDARMDQLRSTAYLDLLNGTPAQTRIASGQLAAEATAGTAAGEGYGTAGAGPGSGGPSPRNDDGGTGNDDPDNDDPDKAGGDDPDTPGGADAAGAGGHLDAAGDGGPRGESPSGACPPGGTPPGARPAGPASPPRLTDLVLPLATLLGLGERPGEGHGLGPLDPQLCRDLAAAAAASPWTRLCVTVTDNDGIATGHGCARPARRKASRSGPRMAPGGTSRASTGSTARLALPARVQLTITASRLKELAAATGPPGQSPWGLTRGDDPGPPGGFGGWTLTLPDGRRLAVALEPMPTFGCDHRHESHAYQPGDTLRHLVQVRDGECTFPPCSRHARETDFEHAIPYDKGGRTCSCNAGSRSRQCHRVKQSPGWNVTQPKPGWHIWTTPTGRTYTQGPKRYPV
jgi:hypothetical protein